VPVVGILGSLLIVLLPILTTALVLYIKAKHHYTVTEGDRKIAETAAFTAIMLVEQNVRKGLKLGEKAPDGTKKLAMGLGYLEKILKASGVYDRFKDEMKDLIESQVALLNGRVTQEEKDAVIEIEDEKTKPAIKPLPKKPIG
jgi:hypothetical protein